jgi:hypothetical protein
VAPEHRSPGRRGGSSRDAQLKPIAPAPRLSELFPDGIPSHLDTPDVQAEQDPEEPEDS